MKSEERHIIRCLPTVKGLMCCLLAWILSSCSSLIDEDLSDCLYGTGIRFEYLIYDDNGGAADAFSTSVDLVSLYIFDDEGNTSPPGQKAERLCAIRNGAWHWISNLVHTT